MTMEPCENSPYRWLSNLAERYALSIALVDRSSGQTLSYSALRSLLISELENLCSILAPFRTVWIVEERRDHIIVPYLVGLVMNKRVCVVSRQAFAAALDAFRRSTDNLALIYGDIQATEDPDFWRGQLFLVPEQPAAPKGS